MLCCSMAVAKARLSHNPADYPLTAHVSAVFGSYHYYPAQNEFLSLTIPGNGVLVVLDGWTPWKRTGDCLTPVRLGDDLRVKFLADDRTHIAILTASGKACTAQISGIQESK